MRIAIENTFKSDVVGADGVARIPDVTFGGAGNKVVKITIRTDVLYSSQVARQANLVIQATGASTAEILNFRGADSFADSAPFAKQNRKGVIAIAKGSFKDRCHCVPPLNPSPPCKNPQVPFDLVDNGGKPTSVSGSGFVVSGTLGGDPGKYPEGAIVTGSLVLICE